jgi:hypothetical protein
MPFAWIAPRTFWKAGCRSVKISISAKSRTPAAPEATAAAVGASLNGVAADEVRSERIGKSANQAATDLGSNSDKKNQDQAPVNARAANSARRDW